MGWILILMLTNLSGFNGKTLEVATYPTYFACKENRDLLNTYSRGRFICAEATFEYSDS